MTSTAQILEAFKTNVFDDSSIQQITKRAFQFDISANINSMSVLALLKNETTINFFSYTSYREQITSDIRGNNTSSVRFRHTVEIYYFIECRDGAVDKNYNEAISAIETVDDLIRSAMGRTWNSTVDYYEFVGINRPELVDIAGKKAWKIGHFYRGTKQI